jgi:hypothetical protein
MGSILFLLTFWLMFSELRVDGAEVLVIAYRGFKLDAVFVIWSVKWILSNDHFVFQTVGHIVEM